MIFIDSNVPMYLVGAAHPNKEKAKALLESFLRDGNELVTDAEVFQEILHRYVAIQRPEAIGPAFDVLQATTDDIYPVEIRDVLAAKEILDKIQRMTARDAIHLAVMRRRGICKIFSFDADFDNLPGIIRIY